MKKLFTKLAVIVLSAVMVLTIMPGERFARLFLAADTLWGQKVCKKAPQTLQQNALIRKETWQ